MLFVCINHFPQFTPFLLGLFKSVKEELSCSSCNVFMQIMLFGESLNFQIHENHRYLNVSVWSKSENGTKLVGRGDRDVLLGHISIPLSSIASECCATKLGHHIKSYFLLPPEPDIAMR
jgi:hypothetical protein